MSIYLNKDSKIIVQGMTGGMGSKHTTLMVQAGSNIVGGVNARKAGTSVELAGKDLPVFGNVAEAMKETGADVSVVFVPPAFSWSSPRACPCRTRPRSGPTWTASPRG
jgi:succinyl-CoA synthetase alpha subunit